jgi:hypothetical protein
MKEKKQRESLIPGIEDAVFERAFELKHTALLIAVVRECFEDATKMIEQILPCTKISRIDRVKLLVALGEARETLETKAGRPETYERYQALSMSMVKLPKELTEASAP